MQRLRWTRRRRPVGPLWNFRTCFGFQGGTSRQWSVGKRNIDEKTHAVLDVVPMCLACSGDFF